MQRRNRSLEIALPSLDPHHAMSSVTGEKASPSPMVLVRSTPKAIPIINNCSGTINRKFSQRNARWRAFDQLFPMTKKTNGAPPIPINPARKPLEVPARIAPVRPWSLRLECRVICCRTSIKIRPTPRIWRVSDSPASEMNCRSITPMGSEITRGMNTSTASFQGSSA